MIITIVLVIGYIGSSDVETTDAEKNLINADIRKSITTLSITNGDSFHLAVS